MLAVLSATLLNLLTPFGFLSACSHIWEKHCYSRIWSSLAFTFRHQQRSAPNPSMFTQFYDVCFLYIKLYCQISLTDFYHLVFPFFLQTYGASTCPSKDSWGGEGGFWCKLNVKNYISNICLFLIHVRSFNLLKLPWFCSNVLSVSAHALAAKHKKLTITS